jgi:Uma2 family endonuclease
MPTAIEAPEEVHETLADVLERIGKVPLARIPAWPPPGMAKEKHVLAALEASDKRLFELVDGVLVEKTMGVREGMLATLLGHFLWDFVMRHDIGLVVGADSPFRLRLGLIRIPDVSFVGWDRFPNQELPDQAIARFVPDLAVEVISQGNTRKEMERKLKDYFRAGVRLVWFIYPKTQTARAYTSPRSFKLITREQALDGGDVLPGFALPLRELFAHFKKRGR